MGAMRLDYVVGGIASVHVPSIREVRAIARTSRPRDESSHMCALIPRHLGQSAVAGPSLAGFRGCDRCPIDSFVVRAGEGHRREEEKLCGNCEVVCDGVWSLSANAKSDHYFRQPIVPNHRLLRPLVSRS